MEQARLARLLLLLTLLTGPRYYSVKDLGKLLGMNSRTVYRYLWTLRDAGFSMDKARKGYFRLQYSKEIACLRQEWDAHEKQGSLIDMFNTSGDGFYRIRLALTFRAHEQLLREYPDARRYVTKDFDRYVLDTTVYSLEGVAHFVIGLAEEIAILRGEELKEYIRGYVAKHLANI